MRRLPFLVLLCTIFVIVSAGAASAQSVCPRSNPETSVKKYNLKPRYFRGTSAWFLTAWTGHWSGGVVLGLHTGANGNAPFWANYDTKFDFVPAQGNPNAWCVMATKIRMNFYIQPVVHIASEYPEDSCEFREILKHEKKHVKVTQDWQKEFTPLLRREMHSIASKIPASPPVGEKQVPAAQQAVVNIIKANLEKYMEEKAIPVLVRRQAKVDDPLEYRLVPTRCDNWQDYHITAYDKSGFETADDEGGDDSGGDDGGGDDDGSDDSEDGGIGNLPTYGDY